MAYSISSIELHNLSSIQTKDVMNILLKLWLVGKGQQITNFHPTILTLCPSKMLMWFIHFNTHYQLDYANLLMAQKFYYLIEFMKILNVIKKIQLHNTTPNKQITQIICCLFWILICIKKWKKSAYKVVWVKKKFISLHVSKLLARLSYHTCCIYSKTFRVKTTTLL
jgi:hypothetical protein